MMIGFFIKSSREEGEVFSKYVWAFRNLFKSKIDSTLYSNDIDLFLIMYEYESKFVEYPAKDFGNVSHRPKEKSASMVVGVKKEFANLSDSGKKEFVISSTFKALEIFEIKAKKKGLDMSRIPKLILDLTECAEIYRKMNVI